MIYGLFDILVEIDYKLILVGIQAIWKKGMYDNMDLSY